MEKISQHLRWLLLVLLLLTFPFVSVSAKTKIIFWHAMGGQLGIIVDQLVKQFNQSQNQYEVIPVYKGTYTETLTETVAAFRAHEQPDLVQIFEVGTATMMYPKGAIVPVYKIMQQANIPFSTKAFIPAIGSYYSNPKGQLVAMPFNSSSAVMFYNKNAFKKAGLDPNKPPKTWPQLEQDAKKLLRAGFSCGFTTGWPSWIQVESFSAWHNLPVATEDNGMAGANAKLIFNNPTLIRQVATLARWEKSGIFRYGGRQDDAQALFTSSKCPIIMESSGARAGLVDSVNFKVGIAPLPYWPDVKGAPQNTIIGGGALWVMTGHSKKVYRGIAKFFAFLLSPKVQAKWQRETGYLPVTKAGYELNKKRGYYAKTPGADVAIKELTNKPPTPNSRGIRLGYYPQIRNIIDQELEAAWSGQKTAKQAMDDAVKRGNKLLQRFTEVAG